ncbi:hypothetical protein YPPY48_3068, partial [Yersinia pestis PY-48]
MIQYLRLPRVDKK